MASGHRARDILVALAAAGGPPAVVRFHRAVLEMQAEIEAMTRPPAVDTGAARERLSAGLPLLSERSIDAVVDGPAFRELARRVCLLIAAHRPDLGAAMCAGLEAADEAVRDCIVTHAGRAFLRPVACALAPLVGDDDWHITACPVCGGAPDMAALGAAGERQLLCARCDTEWRAPRIGCAYCGDDRPEDVVYHPVGEGDYRLYVCARCGGYLKTVDRRQRVATCLAVERILTVGLDAAALATATRVEDEDED